jgi:hypothetical protein
LFLKSALNPKMPCDRWEEGLPIPQPATYCQYIEA